jgi:Ni,Fe-hydrogenase I cytochrome b subunit
MIASLIASYFLQRISDETRLNSLEEIAYFFGNRLSFFTIGSGLFFYYSLSAAEYICNHYLQTNLVN